MKRLVKNHSFCKALGLAQVDDLTRCPHFTDKGVAQPRVVCGVPHCGVYQMWMWIFWTHFSGIRVSDKQIPQRLKKIVWAVNTGSILPSYSSTSKLFPGDFCLTEVNPSQHPNKMHGFLGFHLTRLGDKARRRLSICSIGSDETSLFTYVHK